MTQLEIIEFININAEDRILNMYDKLYEKQKELNKRNDRLTIYLVVTVLFYFIASKATISNIQIGPISLTDLSLIQKLIPAIFAYLFFDYALTNVHRSENIKLLKWVNFKIFKHKLMDKDLKKTYFNDFARLILPYSLMTEIGKVNDYNNKLKWVEVILVLPLLSLIILPFCFEFITIKNVIINYWPGWIAKVSVVFSLWLTIIIIYFYIKIAKNDSPKEKNVPKP